MLIQAKKAVNVEAKGGCNKTQNKRQKIIKFKIYL